MPKVAFSDRWLRNVTAKTKQDEYTDLACPNLRLRVSKKAKTFGVMIGSAKNRRRVTLGRFPDLSLKAARDKAAEMATSPVAKRVAKKEARYGTIADLFDYVIQSLEDEGKEVKNNAIYLRDGPKAAIHTLGPDTLARNVRSNHVTDWLRKIHRSGIGTRHPRAYLSGAFSRGIVADNDPTKEIGDILFGIDSNPVEHVGGGSAGDARDRKLSMDELKFFWREFPKAAIERKTATAVQLIISMGGTRITEILRSKKDWWQDSPTGLWLRIPKSKNKTQHALPLPRHAEILLEEALEISFRKDTQFVFPKCNDPDACMQPNSLSQAVRRFCDDVGMERFQPRDIRRTMKSHLLDAEEDLREEWVDIWHNHGRHADVARKHYDRAEYKRAKGKVADTLDRIIDEITQQ